MLQGLSEVSTARSCSTAEITVDESDEDEEVSLFAVYPAGNGHIFHMAKVAKEMEHSQNKGGHWNEATVTFFRKIANNQRLLVDHLSTAVASAHSEAIRDTVTKSQKMHLTVDVTDVPISWHAIRVAIKFMRTGRLNFHFNEIVDMLKVVTFLRIPEMRSLVESYLRHMSTQSQSALTCLNVAFSNDYPQVVTYETRESIADAIAEHFEKYSNAPDGSLFKNTSIDAIAAVLKQHAQRSCNQRDPFCKSSAAKERCKMVINWLHYNPRHIMNAQRLFANVCFEEMTVEELRSTYKCLVKAGYEIYTAAEGYLIDASFELQKRILYVC